MPPTRKSNLATPITVSSEAETSFMIFSFRPSRMDATPMREATPMATPRMIRPLRSLCARTISRAMTTFSSISPRRSLIAQCLNRIEPGGLHRGIEAREQPDLQSNRQPGGKPPRLYGGGQRREVSDQSSPRKSPDNSENAARAGKRDRLHQELPQDIHPRSSH